MKTRKIVVSMEIETNASLKSLKNTETWKHDDEGFIFKIKQIQVNVIKEFKYESI